MIIAIKTNNFLVKKNNMTNLTFLEINFLLEHLQNYINVFVRNKLMLNSKLDFSLDHIKLI